jgi:NTP pyrophosphatase (non-canonical NTP hydrolase)
MQDSIQDLVKDFNEASPIWKTPDTPTLMPDSDELDMSLLQEELAELDEAMSAEDIVEIADALGDIVVVAFGAALRRGINLQAVIEEVMKANMTKVVDGQLTLNGYDTMGNAVLLAMPHLPRGKILKPESYVAPDITKVLGF